MVLSATRELQDVQQALQWLRAHGAKRLVIDSRQLRAGDAFVAWPGAAVDARRFVGQALAAGACACLVDPEGAQAYAFDDERIATLPRLKTVLGDLAAAFHDHPSALFEVVAFTGTNGKTSSAWWTAQACALLGHRSGLVGTLGVGEPPCDARPGHWQATGLTTPDPVALQSALARWRDEGLRRCVLEASSIGIVENRLRGLRITVAVFTNFTQDHLDYHGSLEAYWQAKRQLFDGPDLRAAVVNIDDPKGRELAAELRRLRPSLELWTIGEDPKARVRVRHIEHGPQGLRFELLEADRAKQVCTPFIGHYNVLNLLGVVAALRCLGHTLDDVVSALAGLTAVPGRMEAHGAPGEPLAVVDYAHTPDALEKALQALRPMADARGGRLWCVFGCGGDRDRGKRPIMGRVAAAGADRVVLTSDNPRSEPPQAILADILEGVSVSDRARVEQEAERAAAVARALVQAAPQDVVLVAGKGHEDHQEVLGVKRPSRDADLIALALEYRRAEAPPFLNLGDMAAALPDARLFGPAALVPARVHSDTRSLQAGDLFVALRGERFDAHEFLAQARASGAVAALAERGLQEAGLPGLEVPDSLKALQQLARHWRAALSMPVIAVTGSNGKTTVTQMSASILRAWLGERAAATRGNLNNHIGVPLSVLALRRGAPSGHRAAVLELGMNHPGEIAELAAIAQPTVALVNNAQREHQEFMESVKAVALENGAVLQALGADGVAVFPADDEHAALWLALAGNRPLRRFRLACFESVSEAAEQRLRELADRVAAPSADAEVLCVALWRGTHWDLLIRAPEGVVRSSLTLAGRHNVHNAVAAATCALAAGAPVQAVAQGLTDFRAVQGRSMMLQTQRRGYPLSLVDDSYNANPDSVRAAIDLLSGLPAPRALVLGDMGEVGHQGPAFHAEVGRHAAARGIDQVWTTGVLGAHTAQAVTEGGGRARHFDTVEDLMAHLDELPHCASILVKGSRFMRMERVVQALQPTAEVH